MCEDLSTVINADYLGHPRPSRHLGSSHISSYLPLNVDLYAFGIAYPTGTCNAGHGYVGMFVQNVDPYVRSGVRSVAHVQTTCDERATMRCECAVDDISQLHVWL